MDYARTSTSLTRDIGKVGGVLAALALISGGIYEFDDQHKQRLSQQQRLEDTRRALEVRERTPRCGGHPVAILDSRLSPCGNAQLHREREMHAARDVGGRQQGL